MKHDIKKRKKSRCISRFISLAIAVMMALTVFALPIPAVAETFGNVDSADVAYAVTGGNIYFDEATGTITGCDDTVTEAIIPAKINGVDVKKIGEMAFMKRYEDNTTLVSVSIPDGVVEIGSQAFNSCTSLKTVTIPDSVANIGESAFNGCTSLAEVNIPRSLTEISSSTFYCCSSLKAIVIPDGVTSIGVAAFTYARSLTSIHIPDSVTSIVESAFYYCPELIIYGEIGSYAQTFAKARSIPFVSTTPEKLAQSITGKTTFSKTFGNKPFSLGAKAKTTLTYKSSNTKLATVSSKGIVTLKNPGTVKITVTAKETSKYKKAAKTITIKTSLKKPSLAVKACKGRKTKLTWNKVPGATKYQVYMYDAKKKKYVCKITKGSGARTAWHKGMVRGKTYRYKVRAYRVVNGKKVYSPFSAVKKAKAK